MDPLPEFIYHPNPLVTGALEISAATCECCNRQRGCIYSGSIYSKRELEAVCPWCIADGTLHEKFDASLSDDHPLLSAGIAASIVTQVTCRTPGYVSWQQEEWLACCNDACEFHGDATKEEIRGLDDVALAALSKAFQRPLDELQELRTSYAPSGSPTIFKFICRHCGRVHYGWDCD